MRNFMIKYCHLPKETFISNMLVDIYRNGRTKEGEEMNFEGGEATVSEQFLLNHRRLISECKRLRADLSPRVDKEKQEKRSGPRLYQTSRI